ncbi:MAG: preprotein translocase subunit SecG [bacterium]|nr:preprotein translocase subunit SecG [bacterium]
MILLKFLWSIQVISAILLIVLVLMHSPKGDGIAGIGNAAQMFTSQKSAEKGLNKLTAIIAIIFVVTVFVLGFGIVK